MSDGLVVALSSEIWEDKVPGDCFEECGGSVRLGTQTLSQIHGFQGKSSLFLWAGLVMRDQSKGWTFKLMICSRFPPPLLFNQSFADLPHRPVLVDLTVEEGQRLKVIYGSCAGFHAIDVDSGNNYDIYIPVHVSYAVVRQQWLLTCETYRSSSLLFSSQTDPEPRDTARNCVPAQLRRHGNAAVLRGRRRLRQHIRTHH